MTMTFSRPSTPSISDSSCGTIVFSTSLETPEPRVRKIESISSKNTMTGMPSLAFSRARWKTSLMCRSVSPTYLFSSSGPLMFRKKLLPSLVPLSCAVFSATCLASEFATALAISVLPQLDGVPDLLDLAGQAADVVVGDVRHFLQDELFHLGLGDPLIDIPGPGLEQE